MNDTAQHVEEDVREAVASGEDIYQKVRAATLKALTERELDRDNIADVVHAVGKGISSGMSTQFDSAREVLQQSTKALDDALASTAEATKLAMEEASSKMGEFTRNDLKQSSEDLKELEKLFIRTVSNLASESQGVLSDVVNDLVQHFKISGTAVGKEAQATLDTMKQSTLNSEHAAFASARDTASALAKIGSGILAGIAESLKADHTKK